MMGDPDVALASIVETRARRHSIGPELRVGVVYLGNMWKYGFASSTARAKEGRAIRRSK